MVFSSRERYIVIATVAVLSIFVLDRFVLTPLFEQRSTAEQERESLLHTLQAQQQMLQRHNEVNQRWKTMQAGGLARDATLAENTLLHSFRQWSSESGLTLTSLKPERPVEGKSLHEVVLQASATGTINAISHFLWLIEAAQSPVRIKQMQLGTRKEGADDLSLTITLSTVYIAPETEPPKKSAVAAGREES